jgi:hypothetical protein
MNKHISEASRIVLSCTLAFQPVLPVWAQSVQAEAVTPKPLVELSESHTAEKRAVTQGAKPLDAARIREIAAMLPALRKDEPPPQFKAVDSTPPPRGVKDIKLVFAPETASIERCGNGGNKRDSGKHQTVPARKVVLDYGTHTRIRSRRKGVSACDTFHRRHSGKHEVSFGWNIECCMAWGYPNGSPSYPVLSEWRNFRLRTDDSVDV